MKKMDWIVAQIQLTHPDIERVANEEDFAALAVNAFLHKEQNSFKNLTYLIDESLKYTVQVMSGIRTDDSNTKDTFESV